MPVTIRQKINSPGDLEKLRQRICDQAFKTSQKKTGSKTNKTGSTREQTTNPGYEILVCTGGSCLASGSLKVKEALIKEVQNAGLTSSINIKGTGCLGPCVRGPVIIINPGETFYQNVKADDAADIIGKHITKGQILDRLVYKTEKDEKKYQN